MSNHSITQISLASIALVFVSLFLFVAPSLTTSAYSINNATPALPSSPATNATPGHVVPSTPNSQAAYTVVTDLKTDELQVIQGTKFVGEISTSSSTWGVAYDPVNTLFYAGGYSCECVMVVNASALKVVTTISINEPATGVAYSSSSGYIYAETYTDPGTYVVINPSTNTVVTTLDACGRFAEFIDTNLKTGDVYASDEHELYGGRGCIDEISGTKIVATTKLVERHELLGISANQKTGDVLVNTNVNSVCLFTSALQETRCYAVGASLWGAWSNHKDGTNNLALIGYDHHGGMGIVSSKFKITRISTDYEVADGCSAGTGNYAPQYGSGSGIVAYISSSGKVTYIDTDGSSVFGCATS